MPFRHERTVERIAVAAGAAQADGAPDVTDLRRTFGEQHGPFGGQSVFVRDRIALLIDDRAVPAEPGRMMTPAAKVPLAGDPVAAVDPDRLGVRGIAPRQG